MNYLILTQDGQAFYTNWFDAENNFTEGMTVFNLLSHKFTIDGYAWLEIQQDHL